jgi:signal transduction histidine kinase
MPVEVLAALITAFIAVLVAALYALRQRVRAAEARMELVQVGQKLKNIGAEVAGSIAKAEAERDRALAILDALPTPVWRRGPDHALAYCNRSYAAAVGLDPKSAVSEATELPGKAQTGLSRALAGRAVETGEMASERLHVVVGGERRLMELFEIPLAARASEPGDDGSGDGGTVGLALDRTVSEELRGELKRHIEAHAVVLEALGSGIAIFGPDMHLKFFNTAYARLWELEEQALSGEPHLNDIQEMLRERRRLPEQSDFPAYKRDQVRLFSTLIEPHEELLHLPDGTTLRLLATPHPFGGVLMSFEDVTDRLALERSYNTLIAVQRETLDHLFEGVAVYGADGRLQLFNPVYARLWSLSESFLAGQPHVREVVPQTRAYFDVADADWPVAMERIVAQSTEPNARGRRRERADGSVVEWAQVPLPDGANLFTFLDVTDSTRVERALRERNEALETADRLKSEFIANVSYELRTPLNAIVGFAEILENQYFGELNDRQMEYSQAIVESSQRLHTLINDILDLATIEAGYLRLDLGEVKLHAMLESIYNLGFERARNRGIDLALDCPPDIGIQIADELRLKQALFNLLSNAVKYTPEGGRVVLSARRRADGVELSVTDTGVGIDEADQDRVFESFERGGGRRQSGAGLGLSLVKRLIELHGGWVTLQSKEGEGTSVTCFIPDEPPRQQPAPPEEPSSAAEAGEPEDAREDAPEDVPGNAPEAAVGP